MSRALEAAMLAAIQAGTVRPVLFYEGEFSNGTLNLWSGIGSLSWDSKTWTGAGDLGSISAARETIDLQAVGFSVALQGESDAMISINIGACRQGLPGTVWLGALDAAGAVIDSPFILFRGRLNVPNLVDDARQIVLSVSYESVLVDLRRPRARRYTDLEQRLEHSGDRGFEFVTALQNAQLGWGGPGAYTLPKALQ